MFIDACRTIGMLSGWPIDTGGSMPARAVANSKMNCSNSCAVNTSLARVNAYPSMTLSGGVVCAFASAAYHRQSVTQMRGA